MSITPGHNESGPDRFAKRTTPATPPGQTGPTQRITGFRLTPDRSTRDRRTRRTVDLPLATHRSLDVWQREAADRIGVARVTGQEVITALIDQLLVDARLSTQITRALQARR
jgi:hypothetical protein